MRTSPWSGLRPWSPILLVAALVWPGGLASWAQTPASPVQPPAATADAAEAPNALLRDAMAALSANQLPQAHALLDRVQTLAPTQPGLAGVRGLLSLREGHPAAAVDQFRTELREHPDAVSFYVPLVAALVEAHRRPEALAALEAWSTAAPTDPRPVGDQLAMLVADGRPAEAVAAGNAGLAHLPEAARNDVQIGYSLGCAELQTGAKPAGAQRLLSVLSLTDDLFVRNGIAFALADAGVELPTAEATERAVLNQLELQSEGWSLNGDPQAALLGTRLLTASWDTLGWVLLKQGKAALAEPLLRAAWRNTLQADIGDHLSQAQAALGQTAVAQATLAVAVAAGVAHPPETAADRSALQAMQQRLAASPQAGDSKKTPAGDAAARLARLRSFPLGASGGRNGAAMYRVLLARGRVAAAHREPDAPIGAPAQLLTGPAATPLLAHADLLALFPAAGSYTQLMYRAQVRCDAQSCMLELAP